MNSKIMLSPHSELPLKKDRANLFLEIIMAITVFLFSVALAGYLLINSVVESWNSSISGSLTVQIMPATEELSEQDADLRVNKVITFFESRQGVKKVILMSDVQLQQLMSPWLGTQVDVKNLPLPKLLEVYLTSEQGFDYAAAAADLKEVASYASIDDHRVWLHRLLKLASSVKMLALTVLLMILTVCVFSIFYATCTSLGIYKDIIEILHIMGAKDDYVARQYAKRGLYIGLYAGLVGIALALCGFALLHYVAEGMNKGLLGDISLSFSGWSALASLPIWTALLSMVTSYYAVRRTLGKIM